MIFNIYLVLLSYYLLLDNININILIFLLEITSKPFISDTLQ